MPIEETRVVVEGFLHGQAGQWLAEDAELSDGDWPPRQVGRPEVTAWFARWDQVTPLLGRVLVGDGRAAAELTLHGGAGHVVSAVAIFEVQGGEIARLRLYYDPASPSSSRRSPDPTERKNR